MPNLGKVTRYTPAQKQEGNPRSNLLSISTKALFINDSLPKAAFSRTVHVEASNFLMERLVCPSFWPALEQEHCRAFNNIVKI